MNRENQNLIYDNPNSYVQKYFKLAQQFDEVKKLLKTDNENYVDYFLNIIGLKIPSSLHNPNFYHFCSEAWILTVFDTMRLNKMKKIETFNDLIEKIKKVKINENKFSENLEILLGTYKIQEHIIKITQIKLSNLFLKKISITIGETMGKNLSEEISREKFEDLIFLSLVKAVNYTLNELTSNIDNKSSLLFLNIFTELNHDQKLKSEHFVEEVLKYHKQTEEETNKKIQNYSNIEYELMNPSIIFYDFAKSDFKALTKNLQGFIYNSADALTKIKLFLRHNIINIKNYLRFSAEIFYKYLECSRLKSAYEYLHNTYLYLASIKNEGAIVVVKNLKNLKNWIDSSYIGDARNSLINISKYCKNEILYKNIFMPIKFLLLESTDTLLKIVVFTLNCTREKLMMAKSLITNLIFSVIGEGPYLKYSENFKDEYVCFEINKELLPSSNKKIRELIEGLKFQLWRINLLQFVAERSNVNKLRNFCYDKLRNFLGYEEEKIKPNEIIENKQE